MSDKSSTAPTPIPFVSLNQPRIQKNPYEPTFFSNRALTRIRLSEWPGVEHDARAAIELYGHKNASRLKSCSYLAQALLGLQQPQEAYDVAIDAYRASLAAKSAQTENLSKLVLRAKQAIWAAKETARMREMNQTLGAVEAMIEADLNRALEELQGRSDRGEIGHIALVEDQKELRADAEKNIQNVRDAFRVASKGEIQERVSRGGFCRLKTLVLMLYRLSQTTSLMESPSKSCMTRSSHRPEALSIA